MGASASVVRSLCITKVSKISPIVSQKESKGIAIRLEKLIELATMYGDRTASINKFLMNYDGLKSFFDYLEDKFEISNLLQEMQELSKEINGEVLFCDYTSDLTKRYLKQNFKRIPRSVDVISSNKENKSSKDNNDDDDDDKNAELTPLARKILNQRRYSFPSETPQIGPSKSPFSSITTVDTVNESIAEWDEDFYENDFNPIVSEIIQDHPNLSVRSSSSSKIYKLYTSSADSSYKTFIHMIAFYVFPTYLKSIQFMNLRRNEINKCYSEARLLIQNNQIESRRNFFANVDLNQRLFVAKSSFLSAFVGSVEKISIPILIIPSGSFYNTKFPITYVNESFAEMVQLPPTQVVGESFSFFLENIKKNKNINIIKKALKKKTDDFHIEIPNIFFKSNNAELENDKRSCYSVSFKPLFDHLEKCVGFIFMFIDLKQQLSHETSIHNTMMLSESPFSKIELAMSFIPNKLAIDDELS